MKQQPTLETARLVLRPFELSDSSEVQRLAGTREVAATTCNVPHPYEDGMAESWIATHRQLFESDAAAIFAIVGRERSQLMGSIGLGINGNSKRAELGYWVGHEFWGRGYCTEAARALVDYGFRILGLHRVHATHMKQNSASGRVMQKLGMTHEGCARDHIQKWGEWIDLESYGLLASEWTP